MEQHEANDRHEAHIELANLTENFYGWLAQLVPEAAQRAGKKRPDFFPDTVSQQCPFPLDADRRQLLTATYRETLEQLTALDPRRLGEYQRRQYKILEHTLRSLLGLAETRTYLTPIDHTVASRPWTFMQDAQMLGSFEFMTLDDYELFAQHMRQWPQWVDKAIQHMLEGVREAYVQPKCITARTLQRLEAFLSYGVTGSPFLSPLGNMWGRLPVQEQMQIDYQYRQLVEAAIVPGYQRLHTFMGAYQDFGLDDDKPGLCYLPGGAHEYQKIVEYYTMPHIDIPSLHEEAKRRVDELMRCVESQGPLQRARRANQPSFDSPQEVVASYKELTARVQRTMPQYFGWVPDAPLQLSVPHGNLTYDASAHYRAAGTGLDRTGKMILPIADVNTYSRLSMDRLVRHEGWPGHHMVNTIHHKSHIRTTPIMLPNITFEEGWAMYAEMLDARDGLLSHDDEYRLSCLQGELSIARGVVLETGMHALGWSLEQAYAYRRAHNTVQESPAQERDDILRFVAWPGQCLTYYEGAKHFNEARRLAEAALEDEFDIREFHDFMLAEGPMPLVFSRERLGQWLHEKIEAQINRSHDGKK